MENVRSFADLFGSKLYGTGFGYIVRDSGLGSCVDLADAREAIAYILGAAKQAESANRLLASLAEKGEALLSVEEYEKAARTAEEVYAGFALIRDSLVTGRSASQIQSEIDAFEAALLALI